MSYKFTTVIEFNSSDVRVVRCQHHGAHHTIVNYDVAEFSLDQKKDLTQALLRFIKVKSLNMKNHRVVVLLPGQEFLYKYLRLPSQKSEEIATMVDLQLESLIPYSLDEVTYHHKVINVQKNGYAHVLCLCVSKESSLNYLNIVRELGVDSFVVTLGALGYAHYQNYLKVSADDTNLFINCDANNIIFVFYRSSKLIYARTLRFGWSNNNETIEKIINELELTVKSFEKETLMDSTINYFLIGHSSDLNELKDSLDKCIDTFVQVLEVNSVPNLTFKPKAQTHNNLLSTNCIGVSLADDESLLNFIPEHILSKTKRRKDIKSWMAIIGLFFGICLLAFFGYYGSVYKKKEYLNNLKERYSIVKDENGDLNNIIVRLSKVQKELDETVLMADVMHSFYEIFPKNATLTLFNVTRKKLLTLQGQTLNTEDVSILQKRMVETPYFSNVTLDFVNSSKSKEGNMLFFQITSQLQSGI